MGSLDWQFPHPLAPSPASEARGNHREHDGGESPHLQPLPQARRGRTTKSTGYPERRPNLSASLPQARRGGTTESMMGSLDWGVPSPPTSPASEARGEPPNQLAILSGDPTAVPRYRKRGEGEPPNQLPSPAFSGRGDGGEGNVHPYQLPSPLCSSFFKVYNIPEQLQ